jgi:uncharacterized protein YndB with AHSA1/START domain
MILECKATTIKTTFSRETSVGITIRASPSIVWSLLTTAEDYTRWNSTVISVTGEIKLGKTIRLVSKLDPKREFKLTVKEFDPEKRMAWGDGKGIRVYTLADEDDGTLRFSMIERIGGLMFPLYSRYIPPSDESFERFATDLKQESEIKHSKSA